MPGTRTAPTIDGASYQFKVLSLTWYDHTGDIRTDSYQIDGDSTPLEIEAFVAAMQAVSNATLWKVQVADIYNSVGDSDNALEEVWENAKDNLVVQAKNATNDSRRIFVPSPINGMFIEGTENIDPTNVALGALLTAYLPLVAGYSVVGARFTHRRQINQQTRF